MLQDAKKANAPPVTTSTGTALVLLDLYQKAEKANDEAIAANFGGTKQGRKRRVTRSHSAAAADGDAAGRAISLDKQVGNAGTKGIGETKQIGRNAS